MALRMALPGISELDQLEGYSTWLEVVKTYAACQRLMASELETLGLSIAQHEILLALGREEGVPQKRLAERLLVTKSNVTAMLERMEKSGYVERRPDRDDARVRSVHLTKEGRKVLNRTVRKQAGVVALMTEGLSERDLRVLERIMRGVRGRLEGVLGDRPA